MKDSHIEWCHHTFNPWIGCTKVSPGCANCYAETLMDTRYHRVKWGKGNPRARTSAKYWRDPLAWNMVAEKYHRRYRIFCASLADWLDDEVPTEWLLDLLKLIKDTPHLDWLLLTKRPENFVPRLVAVHEFLAARTFRSEFVDLEMWPLLEGWLGEGNCTRPPNNVWLGTSVEDQQLADKRIPVLLDTPAKVRFLSCEPLLGPLDLKPRPKSDLCIRCGEGPGAPHNHPDGYRTRGLDWVIAGGESGPGARQVKLTWYYDLKNQCDLAGVPFFMKQLGSNCMMDMVATKGESFRHFTGPGKGGDLDQIPEQLRVRQFPTVEVPA